MANYEIRTQLYLPKRQYQKIKKMASEKHVSFAQVVREALDMLMGKEQGHWEDDPISRHIGLFKADSDLSVNHDKYIYGV